MLEKLNSVRRSSSYLQVGKLVTERAGDKPTFSMTHDNRSESAEIILEKPIYSRSRKRTPY